MIGKSLSLINELNISKSEESKSNDSPFKDDSEDDDMAYFSKLAEED
jgi:hypothetical protein